MNLNSDRAREPAVLADAPGRTIAISTSLSRLDSSRAVEPYR